MYFMHIPSDVRLLKKPYYDSFVPIIQCDCLSKKQKNTKK